MIGHDLGEIVAHVPPYGETVRDDAHQFSLAANALMKHETSNFGHSEGFYITRRRPSALGHLSPSEYDEVRLRGGAAMA